MSSTAGWCSRTSSRPTSSTATATTPTASAPRCGPSTTRSAPGCRAARRAMAGGVGPWLPGLRGEDTLVVPADHGVDPTMPHRDHTREHAPLLARFDGDGGRRHDGVLSDVGASVLHWLAGRDEPG